MERTLAWHVVAHARGGWNRVCEPPAGAWLWARLRGRFPRARSATLMPNHLHTLLAGDPIELRRRMSDVLRGYSRKFGVRWDVAEPTPVRTRAIAERTATYHWLNPQRAGLEPDPLQWRWSTLREVAGMSALPWPGWRALRQPPAALLRRVMEQAGRPYRHEPPDRSPLVCTVGAVRAAVEEAFRVSPATVQRRGPARVVLIDLATELGCANLDDLALACGAAPRTIRHTRGTSDPTQLAAARACLAHAALRRAA